MSWSSQISWRGKAGWRTKGDAGVVALTKALTNTGLHLSELSEQNWESGFVDGIQDRKLSSLAVQKTGWSSVLLPLNCKWDNNLATELSKQCDLVILFVEVRQTTWGFLIFEKGTITNTFWRSSSFDNLTPSPENVDPQVIAKLFSVKSETISPYLKQIDGPELTPEKRKQKAFPEDQYPLSNHWVRVDFMDKIGITYPDPSNSETRYVLIE